MFPFFAAVFSIILSVAAQFCLKAGMSSPIVKGVLSGDESALKIGWTIATNLYIAGGFILYGMGALVWLAVLSQWDVSKAYPLVGIGFLLTVLVGFLIGEDVTILRVLGVFLIAFGVAIVART